MSRWWRAYEDALDHPKLLLLSDRAHRAWFNLLCLASANGGILPSMEVLCLKLRLKEKVVGEILEELIARNLIDEYETVLRPHDWNGRQFKSDVSTERVKRFRERERNVSETPPETEEQNTESERKKSISGGRSATRPAIPSKFDEFWKAYPKRQGANPKAPAKKLFDAAVKSGADPEAIIESVRRGIGFDREKIGTEFIPQAVKWLRDKRWEDDSAASSAGLSEADREKMFAELRGKNDATDTGHSAQGSDVRQACARNGAHQADGREGRAAASDNQTEHPGMGGVAEIFRGSSGLRTIGDEARGLGPEPGDDGSSPAAK